MSVRIYQLSKQIGIENRELLALLRERGFAVKSVSSTIDNISADALIKEYAAEQEAPPKSTFKPEEAREPEQKTKSPMQSKLPEGVFVKSKEEVIREQEHKKTIKSLGSSPVTGVVRPTSLGSETVTSVVKEEEKTPLPPEPKNHDSARTPQVKIPRPLVEVGDQQPSSLPDLEVEEKSKSKSQVVRIKPPIIVRDFALSIGLKPFRLISELMEMGIFASMNQVIPEEVASQVAKNHDFTLEIKHRGEIQKQEKKDVQKRDIDESELLEPRPPVVCILGHVDHGKTTLLDTIRKTSVAAREVGGITQHIGAYQVTHNGNNITFIDTPGHAAFAKMRERGANVTDIAVLVVAADDGFKPQTNEALQFAQKAGVPVVVAINKTDVQGANIEQVKVELQQKGITSEDWGGETLTVPISALKGEGLQELLDAILLQSEFMELKANPKGSVEGVVIEARVEVGQGGTASGIVQKGTLKVGDTLICGEAYCKVRAIINDQGNKIQSASPSMPVNIIGWSKLPEAGSLFQKVANEKVARRKVQEQAGIDRRESSASALSPISSEDFMNSIAQTQEKVLKVILKADTQGSAEALASCLEATQSDKITLDILSSEAGQISKNDIARASAAGAIIVGFNVKSESGVAGLAKHHNTQILQHNIIYEIIDQVKEVMIDLLDPEIRQNRLGAAQVRQTFPVSKGLVAGCMVTEGRIKRDSFAKVMRADKVVCESRISTLKRFKEDTSEVRAGYECGIQIDGFNSYKEGDIIESFEIEKVRAAL